MRQTLTALVFQIVLLVAAPLHLAQAFDCGSVPVVTDENLKGEIEGKAQLLSRFIGDAELAGNIETAKTDIFVKYPEANKSRTNAYFLYVMCESIFNDRSLSESQKRNEFSVVRREILGEADPNPKRDIKFATISAEVCSVGGYNKPADSCFDIPPTYKLYYFSVEDLPLTVKPGYTNDWCSHTNGCDGNVTCIKQKSIPMSQVDWTKSCDNSMFSESDHRVCIYVRARPIISLSKGGSTHCIGRTLRIAYYRDE